MTGVPVLSGAAQLLAYEYPVHRIGPDFLPDTPGEHPTYLVVFRDRDGRTRFIELNALSARQMLWDRQFHFHPLAPQLGLQQVQHGLNQLRDGDRPPLRRLSRSKRAHLAHGFCGPMGDPLELGQGFARARLCSTTRRALHCGQRAKAKYRAGSVRESGVGQLKRARWAWRGVFAGPLREV